MDFFVTLIQHEWNDDSKIVSQDEFEIMDEQEVYDVLSGYVCTRQDGMSYCRRICNGDSEPVFFCDMAEFDGEMDLFFSGAETYDELLCKNDLPYEMRIEADL